MFLAAISGLIMSGVVLVIYIQNWHKTWDNEIYLEVSAGGQVIELVDTPTLTMIPGEEQEYALRIKAKRKNDYVLTLAFAEKEESPLKEFITVKILQDGTLLKETSLQSLLDGETVGLSGDFSDSKNSEVFIYYIMPYEVGNEAQGANAWFDVYLTAQYQ